jgi:Ca2+-binding EF-hand superfamily protein
MRWLLLVAILPLAGLALAATDEQPLPEAPAVSDVQDLIFLRGDRPLLIRLHIQIDGKPFPAVWDGYMDALFAHLNVDGDGGLGKDEAARAPRAQTLGQLVRGGQGFFLLGQPNTTMKLEDFKPAGDKVTRAEFAAYYRKNGAVAFQLLSDSNVSAQGEALTDVLFKALDKDKDGKLSKEEIQDAANALRKYDTDDDETITIQKLVPNNQQFLFGFQQPGTGPAGGNAPFVAIDPADPAAFVARLLEAFDKDKNKKLSRAEIGLDKEAFDKLDTNGDGELDADELARFATLPPDGEFTVRVGKNAGVDAAERELSLTPSIKKTGDSLTFTAGNTQVNLRRAEAGGGNGGFAVVNTRQTLLLQFRGIDTKKQGFVEKKDVGGQGRGLSSIFDLADRDGDGKLTEKELTAFLDIYDRAAKSFAAVTIANQGRGLFDALDANRDGRLRFHELRRAWDRLSAWDKGGKGYITRADIPGQLQLSVSQGQAIASNRIINLNRLPEVNPPPRAPAKGPLWFRKMDRNGDGVVSRREWLGSIEDFNRFDLNGDGVIDLEEAEKADAEMRKGEEKKD